MMWIDVLFWLKRDGPMAPPTSAPILTTFYVLREAEEAAKVLRVRKIKVKIEKVTELLCPGALRKNGWMLYVSKDDVRRATRILDEAGLAHFLR